MKLRKYIVCLDIGDDFRSIAVPAENEAAAREYVKGNGEVVAIKDVTEEITISEGDVRQALIAFHIQPRAFDFIIRSLTMTGIIK